jgi:hypothetical protein
MRRGVHITVSLLAVFLLLQPFDCFSGGRFTKKAAECCKKGKCAPSSNADDCCKGTLPGGKQVLASKAQVDSTPTVDLITTDGPVPIAPAFTTITFKDVEAAPGSPPGSRLNLPLLI